MIVVDTNVVVYLHIANVKTPQARRAFEKDPAWAAPMFWRSEFRKVLRLYMRQGKLSLAEAVQLMSEAELLFLGAEYPVDSEQVLRLVASSGCTAYDCEFVALAKQLGAPLVTTDDDVLRAFPETALALDAFVSKPSNVPGTYRTRK
jgi:predicted nucleic acid-binding protein